MNINYCKRQWPLNIARKVSNPYNTAYYNVFGSMEGSGNVWTADQWGDRTTQTSDARHGHLDIQNLDVIYCAFALNVIRIKQTNNAAYISAFCTLCRINRITDNTVSQ